MSGLLKRRVRFFTIMGVLIIIFAFWNLFQIPWEAMREISPSLESFFVFNFFVWLSVGMTEIAVAWLLAKHKE